MSSPPRLAHSREALAACLATGPQHRVALVPTMGALHEGHASLFRLARDRVGDAPGGLVVTSIFVNPLQFGVGEDLERYPRPLADDLALCADLGVDVVFAPDVAEMYPHGDPQVTVDPGPLGDVLEGRTRPGHFRGVLTVVARLLGLVQPQVAVFGEKDFQQLTLIRRMVRDLDLPVEVVGGATQRDEDGLALSSRNRYLTVAERGHATALSRALHAGQAAGEQGPAAALAAAGAELASVAELVVDYLELTDPDLAPLPAEVASGTPARLLVAARLGQTRLIDNAALVLGAGR